MAHVHRVADKSQAVSASCGNSFMATTTIEDIRIASRKHKSNPHPVYARLRSESPVCPVRLPDRRTIHLVTRYDDVVTVLKDERFVKNPRNVVSANRRPREMWIPRFARPFTRHMLNMDDPGHARLRGLVNKAFSPQLIEGMRSRIESLTASLLHDLRGQTRIDLIRDYALPLPTTIIAEMLGVPAEDRLRFNHWTNAIMQVGTTRWGMLMALPQVWTFLRYIRAFVRQRQQDPRDDLVSELVRAEVDSDRLNEDEVVGMIFLLLVAGHETTVNLIGNGMLALLEFPDQLQRLREDPSLTASAVEELLRYGSPVEMATERYTKEDVAIADTVILGGSLVGAVIASANRDERQFEQPDTLDITRDPNRHVAFGLGAHYCTGAPLARLEGQIAINALLDAFPQLQLNVPVDRVRWRPGLVTRGIISLPLTVR